MNNLPISTLSNNKFSYNILDSIQAGVYVKENFYNIPLDVLFLMAARINKKRSFLFVSKLLGKHIPIQPAVGLLTSALLAARYYESFVGYTCEYKREWIASLFKTEPAFTRQRFIPSSKNPLVIGFAETATALGHAFFDCFEKADYFHTTREVLQGQSPIITFEEEHSHATSHRCYIPREMINNDREIILVDDELTTGNTALNVIRSIQERFPRKVYTVVTILDWRSEENIQNFKKLESTLGITIHVISLISGKIQIKKVKEIAPHPDTNYPSLENEPEIEEVHLPINFSILHAPSLVSNGNVNRTPYMRETGRFGLNSESNERNQKKWVIIASMLKEKRNSGKTLCLGTGEFMYIPMKIASEMGQDVFYQSTTRSPIFIQNSQSYGARYGLTFPNPEDIDIMHYVYNIPPGIYSDLFLFFEREVERDKLLALVKELNKTKIKSIKLIFFTKE